MEGSRVRGVVMIIVVAVMVVGQWQSSAAVAASSFKECYAKCFLFCMIEPTQTLCSCTTQCLRECIFPAAASNTNTNTNMITNAHAHADQNLGFCKLGCASSLCSNISTKLNPNGQNMESCVGSCSKKCSVGYS